MEEKGLSYRPGQLGTAVSELTFGTSLSPGFPCWFFPGSFSGAFSSFFLQMIQCALCSDADQNTLDNNFFFKLVKKKQGEYCTKKRGEKLGKISTETVSCEVAEKSLGPLVTAVSRVMEREATLVFEEEMEGSKEVEEGVCISLAISLFKKKKKIKPSRNNRGDMVARESLLFW